MTELTDLPMPASSELANEDVLDRLERMSARLFELSLAADATRLNFICASQFGRTTLPFLDADIIRGALPTSLILQPQSMANRSSSLSDIISESEDLTGPNTIHHLLRTIDRFCLPPGTLMELGTHLATAKGRLPHAAKGILDIIEEGKKGKLHTRALLSPNEGADSFANRIIRSLKQFGGEIGDLSLLESVMQRRVPYEDLADSDGLDSAHDAFRKTLNVLDRRRREKPENNWHDALNLAAVAHVLNSSASENRSAAPIPILISDTQLLHDLERKFTWIYRPTLPSMRTIVGGRAYWVISESILKRTGHNLRTASSRAADFHRAIVRLESAVKTLATKLARYSRSGSEWRRLNDLALDWERLELRASQFASDWQFILSPEQAAQTLDHAHFISYLTSPKFQQRIMRGESKLIRSAFQDLEYRLKRYRPAAKDFWQLLQDYRQITNAVELHDCRPTRPVDIVLRVHPPTKALLSQILPSQGATLSSLEHSPAVWQDGFRIALMHMFSCHHCALAFDAWIEPDLASEKPLNSVWENLFYRIIWLHGCHEEEIWQESITMLRRCVNGSPSTLIQWKTFPAGSWQQGTFIAAEGMSQLRQLRQPPEVVRVGAVSSLMPEGSAELIDASTDVSYFEMEADSFTFLADTTPMANAECQAGLIFPARLWSPRICELLAELVWRTSVVPWGERACKESLNYTADQLRSFAKERDREAATQ